MAPPRRRPAQKRTTFSSPASMAQAQRAAEAQSMKALQDRREKTRQEFFKGREDISDDRLDRRQIQDDLLEKFKKESTKLVPGTTNLYQDTTLRFDTNPMSPTFGQYTRTTLADKATELAMKYGPTFREIGSDMGYAIGSMAKGAGDLIRSGNFGILGIAKGLYDKFSSNAAKAKDELVKGFDKLTSVEQEILKDTNKYPKMSSHPRLQGIKSIEEYQMTELDKANLIKENMERVSTNVLEKDNTVQSAKVFDDSFRRLPGSGYQAGAGLPAITNQEDNYIKFQNGQAVPISKEEFLEDQRAVEEKFANDPFFADKMTKTSNQMSGAPGFEIVSDYKSPEARMQELIEQNKVNNTNMFDLGINKAKNQLSELERVFGVDMQ